MLNQILHLGDFFLFKILDISQKASDETKAEKKLIELQAAANLQRENINGLYKLAEFIGS